MAAGRESDPTAQPTPLLVGWNSEGVVQSRKEKGGFALDFRKIVLYPVAGLPPLIELGIEPVLRHDIRRGCGFDSSVLTLPHGSFGVSKIAYPELGDVVMVVFVEFRRGWSAHA
jgi:hypothetical protein